MAAQDSVEPKRSGVLDKIERIGNALPDPVTLFAGGVVAIFVVSWIAAAQEWNSILLNSAGDVALNDEGAAIMDERATSLLSAAGFRWLLETLIPNFVKFPPLGLVLVAAVGIAVAEKSGLITAALKSVLVYVPARFLTPATFFVGVMSSMAVDAGYIVLPPLAAAVYLAAGRSPLVGIAAVTAGVASGFNANLLITGLDPMLAGLTEAAAQLIDPAYKVSATCNWYFMIASTIMLTLVGWALTSWYVEPRLADRSPEEGGPGKAADPSAFTLQPEERSGLAWALVALVATAAVVAACVYFPWGFLYDPPGSLTVDGGTRPFPSWISVIVPILLIGFFVPGLVYGIRAGTIRSDRDVTKMMSEYMSVLGSYIVLAFFASIFVAAFAESNLGKMMAIEGANGLSRFDLPSWVLMVGLILVVAFMNMFIGSMSAKWAILATVFVPMFMNLGISPELTQVTYRIGDSVSNSITPLNPYIVVVLVFMQQYVKKAGLGTLVSVMLPYTIVFGIVWSLMLVAWILLDAPLGPGGPLQYLPQ